MIPQTCGQHVFFPHQKFSSAGETWSWHTKKDWPLLVLLAVFSVAGQALMNLGLTLETAAKATAMNYSQVGWIISIDAFCQWDEELVKC